MKRCIVPFQALVINPDGTPVPCCKYNIDNTDKVIQTANIRTHNIQELFNHVGMQTIRDQFLAGEEPEGCSVCWKEEAAGVRSLRITITEEWKKRKAKEKLQFSRGLIKRSDRLADYDDPKINQFGLKFSTLCNLKCRICGPYCSSNWLKESVETGDFNEHTTKIFSKYAERKFSEYNFELFKEALPNLTHLEFTGGEPFMQPEHDRIMRLLDEYDDLETLILDTTYNTNGTIFHDYSNVWKRMHCVHLNISIDDTGPRFEYQRYPAVWSEVLKNTKKYIEMSKQITPHLAIRIYCTLSLYNIFYFDEFIDYATAEFGNQAQIVLNLVHFPDKLSIRHLPYHIKQSVTEKLSKKTEYKNISKYGNSISEIITYMNETKAEGMDDFYSTTDIHDRYRGQSFEKTFPEYWEALHA